MGKYTFKKQNLKELGQIIDINDISPGTIFIASGDDGESIKDDKGNEVFKAISTVKHDPIMGPYVECISIH